MERPVSFALSVEIIFWSTKCKPFNSVLVLCKCCPDVISWIPCFLELYFLLKLLSWLYFILKLLPCIWCLCLIKYLSICCKLQLSGFKKVLNYTKKVMEEVKYRKMFSREEVMFMLCFYFFASLDMDLRTRECPSWCQLVHEFH